MVFCVMSIKNNDKKDNKRTENLLEIMDGIIDQLNNTKRLFIAMILTLMIISPLVFVIIFKLLEPNSFFFFLFYVAIDQT